MSKLTCSIAASLLFAISSASSALNILLTNDDGWDSPGITATRTALIAAGHTVTLVGPLVNQSGKGGSLIADNGVSVAVVQSGGPGSNIWSVNSTPSDAVRAAFGNTAGGGVLPAGSKPDLLISGINNGQNLGMTGTWASGTINAALTGLAYGVPGIAISAERLLVASDADTIAAMPAIADFTVRLVDRLQQTALGGQILPAGTLLNVNYPVFNSVSRPGSVQGVKVTNLATKSNIEFVWSGNPAATGSMNVGVNFAFYNSPIPDPIANSDKAAMKAGYVSVTPLDGDMTAKSKPGTTFSSLQWRLNGLLP